MIVFDRVDVVIVLVLAFGIQTKRRFGNTKNSSFFNMTLFEGGTRPDLALTVLIFLTGFAFTVRIFLYCTRSYSTGLFSPLNFYFRTDISYCVRPYCTDISS